MLLLQFRTAVRRCCLISGMVLYVSLYNLLYVQWLAPTFDYMGLSYHAPSWPMLELAWLLALLPACWMPLALSRPSQVPLWFIYLTVYIPSMFGPIYMALQSRQDLIGLMSSLALGMMILSVTSFVPAIRLDFSFISSGIFWSLTALLTLFLDLWVVAILHSHMHLVGFGEIYNLRSEADEISAGTGVGYAIMTLSSIINPLFMAYGLVSQKRWLLLLGFFDQVLLYAAGGSKAVILSVFMIAGIYFIIGKSEKVFGLRIVGAVGSSRVDLQACKLEYSIVSPK